MMATKLLLATSWGLFDGLSLVSTFITRSIKITYALWRGTDRPASERHQYM
jgi:hypothetical protein